MNTSQNLIHYLRILTFLGLALHEISHAIFTLLDPAVKFKEIKITLTDGGYVSYEYKDEEYEETIVRSYLRRYAPFYINSATTVYLVTKALQIDGFSVKSITGILVLYFLALSFGSRAMPSETDTYSHWEVLNDNLHGKGYFTVVFLLLFHRVLSVPFMIISKARTYNSDSYYIVAIIYPVFLILSTTLVQSGYIEPINILQNSLT